MKKILVVDDSKTILEKFKIEFKSVDNVEAVFASSYKEAMQKIRENNGEFHAALLDINLPDAPNGEVVSLVNAHHIPSVVLTSEISDKIKSSIKKKDILAYVLKDTPNSMKLAVSFIKRALKNYETTVLIADDSKLYRDLLAGMLSQMNINVIEACDGIEAYDILENSDKHISIVLTDYEMPNLNGFDLIVKIREKYAKNELGIIMLSSVHDKEVISECLKFGANDFIEKPFTKDEVSTRVNSNLELLELFAQISDMANKDYMTGAYNRRYFYDSGKAIFDKTKRKEDSLAVAMIDIDNFKNINDTYGHDIGDIAIKEIKKILDLNLRESDLMARFGGEEFCIVLEDISAKDTKVLFEKIRKAFEDNSIQAGEVYIKYTVSFGISYGLGESLDDMVKLSDDALYYSKENGRNQVTINEI